MNRPRDADESPVVNRPIDADESPEDIALVPRIARELDLGDIDLNSPLEIDYNNRMLLEQAKGPAIYVGNAMGNEGNPINDGGPINWAAKNLHDNIKPIKSLFLGRSTVDVNQIDGRLRTALHIAAYFKNAEIVKFLLKKRAYYGYSDLLLRSPIHYACMDNEGRHNPGDDEKQISIVKQLLAKEAVINNADFKGYTPLMYAVKGPINFDVVELLLKAGAELEKTDGQGNTSLHIALDNPTWETKSILALIKAGAPILKENRNGDVAIKIFYYSENHPLEEKKKLLHEIVKTIYLMRYSDNPFNEIYIEGYDRFYNECYAELGRMMSIVVPRCTSLLHFARDGSTYLKVRDLVLDQLMTTTFDIYDDYIADQFPRRYLFKKIFDLGLYTRTEKRDIFHSLEYEKCFNNEFCQYLSNLDLIKLIIVLRKSPPASSSK